MLVTAKDHKLKEEDHCAYCDGQLRIPQTFRWIMSPLINLTTELPEDWSSMGDEYLHLSCAVTVVRELLFGESEADALALKVVKEILEDLTKVILPETPETIHAARRKASGVSR